MNKKPDKKSNNTKTFQALARFTNIGFTLAATIVISVFIGKFLDDLFGSTPWLLLIFAILGAVAAIRYLFSLAEK